ncbi:MAG TPA: T9SS type A sorting domain-containing protein [Bacteroidia bacterium]|jgi:sugar lactone lactonase YvrE
MIKNFLYLSGVLLSLGAYSQTYNSPESIEFDYANNRWLISNTGGGNILARNSANGALSVFTALPSSPYGIEIVGSVLYVCDQSNHVKGYDLTSAAQVMNLTVTGAAFLNGITHDNNGNLFVTDFNGYKIYRINIAAQTYTTFVSGLTAKPNGIIFDQPNNRCVFVSWGTSAAIRQVNLADSTTSILTATSLGNCDGIAKDGSGNYYVSSWSNGSKITRFNNTFSSSSVVVPTGVSNPADIFYNTVTDTLGVPNVAANNTTYHYFGSSTTVEDALLTGKLNVSVNPNPLVKTAELNYVLRENSNVLIELFDVKGALVKTIVNENQAAGKQTTFFSRSGLAPGTYLLKVETDSYLETKRIIISE